MACCQLQQLGSGQGSVCCKYHLPDPEEYVPKLQITLQYQDNKHKIILANRTMLR